MKKTNNKGFSLVELIIVIAIMAVLIAVLAPQFIRYVERSRYQKDASAVGELENALKVACSDDDVVTAIGGTGWPVQAVITNATGAYSLTTNGTAVAAGNALFDEVTATIGGATLNFTSTTITTDTGTTVIQIDDEGVVSRPIPLPTLP